MTTATHVSELRDAVVLQALLTQVIIVDTLGSQGPVLFGMALGCLTL